LVPVTGRASRLVEPRLRRAVDCINVDDREAGFAHDDDASFAVPLRHCTTPAATNERRDAIHAAAAKSDVARIARERVVTAVAGQGALQRADRIGILRTDAKLLETQHIRCPELLHQCRQRGQAGEGVLDVPGNHFHGCGAEGAQR
jgi:hypothetical protein